MKTRLHTTLGPVFLSVRFTHSAQAQRVMPYYDCDGGVNAMVEYNGQLVLGGSFLIFNGHERRNLQGWDGTAHFDYPEAFDDVNFIVTDMVVFNGDLIVAGWGNGFSPSPLTLTDSPTASYCWTLGVARL